jgi:hypothetical protein
MCSHLGDRAPAKRERDVLLSLPTSTSAGRPESRICLVKSKYTDAVKPGTYGIYNAPRREAGRVQRVNDSTHVRTESRRCTTDEKPR